MFDSQAASLSTLRRSGVDDLRSVAMRISWSSTFRSNLITYNIFSNYYSVECKFSARSRARQSRLLRSTRFCQRFLNQPPEIDHVSVHRQRSAKKTNYSPFNRHLMNIQKVRRCTCWTPIAFALIYSLILSSLPFGSLVAIVSLFAVVAGRFSSILVHLPLSLYAS